MKPIELYKLKPIKITKEIWQCLSHIPEIDTFYHDGIDRNEKVEVKYLANYCFDGERSWVLGSIWFDNKPVMVIQNAGRGWKDHQARFVTDADQYFKMVQYLMELCKPEMIKDGEFYVDENNDIEDLDNFYNFTLKDFYDPEFVPDYHVGDILEVKVPNEHFWGYCHKEEDFGLQKVRVENVDNNPFDTYQVVELNRAYSWNKFPKIVSIQDGIIPDGYYELSHRLNKDLKYRHR